MLVSLINSNITNNYIPTVKTSSRDVCHSQTDIFTTFRDWFEFLFTLKPSSPTPLHQHIPFLLLAAIAALSTPISAANIRIAVASTKKHFTPRIDGIPYAVYTKVPYLVTLLSRVITEALHSGIFPPSWSNTIIRPILKLGQDPALAKLYKLISLICCDSRPDPEAVPGTKENVSSASDWLHPTPLNTHGCDAIALLVACYTKLLM